MRFRVLSLNDLWGLYVMVVVWVGVVLNFCLMGLLRGWHCLCIYTGFFFGHKCSVIGPGMCNGRWGGWLGDWGGLGVGTGLWVWLGCGWRIGVSQAGDLAIERGWLPRGRTPRLRVSH